MAGAAQSIAISLDDEELRRALRRVLRNLEDPSATMRQVGEVVTRSTKDRFRTETDPDGKRWAENADSTLLRYLIRRQGLSKQRTATGGRTLTARGARALGSKRILTDRGHLADSIAYQLAERGRAVAVGTPRVYAAAHQFGMVRGYAGRDRHGRPIPWGDIPARPFLGLSDADRADILAIWRSALTS